MATYVSRNVLQQPVYGINCAVICNKSYLYKHNCVMVAYYSCFRAICAPKSGDTEENGSTVLFPFSRFHAIYHYSDKKISHNTGDEC
jgi:hypothetical protein